MDFLTLILIVVAFVMMGGGQYGVAALILIYGMAPVLAAYNVQLASRGLGNLLLVIKMFAEVGAIHSDGATAAALWIVAALAAAGVILTHKMTTQFMLFAWPIWPLSIGAGVDILFAFAVPVAGLFIAAGATGVKFQARQWAAHAEIVGFWTRRWRDLGGHSFRRSPIYAVPGQSGGKTFHQPGVRGAVSHVVLLGSYLPMAFLLPMSLLWSPPPPTWLIAWLFVALAASILTLFVPFLKGLGGGHLYLFNAVPPAAIWWGLLLERGETPSFIFFAVGFAATITSLAIAYRRRTVLSRRSDGGLDEAIAFLRAEPASRVAAFPWTVPERIAFETHHRVFWGGHGAGLDKLEPFFPVMSRTLREAFSEHRIRWVLLSTTWWPEGEAAIRREFPDAKDRRFEGWILFDLRESGVLQ
ncbi:MAG: hypothetical protein EA385_01825 [Salinarimonadaceae bacterium]|nr:MAG: hypothetical protein EA385_01825 [Salinarimonadaceae bacterium]